MARSDSEERPRLLLFLIFAAVLGLLLFNSIRIWEGIDSGERWARAAELLLITVGAWVVVWPETFPPWRSSKEARGLEETGPDPQESSTESRAPAERPRE
jgi:hypothetical protein